MPKHCLYCGNETGDEALNFCNWDCLVKQARADGGTEHLPNGLPVRCVTAAGLMIECEHGDHPDYMFPITTEYHGTDEEELAHGSEIRALIGVDGDVATTMHEACYATFSLVDGSLISGQSWDTDWRLSDESLAKIKVVLKF